MKRTLLASALLGMTMTAVAQESVRMVVTHKDGTQEVVTSKSNAFDYENGEVKFERDITVSTPSKKPSLYKKGRGATPSFSGKSFLINASSSANANSSYTPNDEFFDEQIHWLPSSDESPSLNNVLASVQRLSPLRRPVIGVVDSGFYGHPDLIYADGYSFSTIGDEERSEGFFLDEQYNGSPEDRILCSVHGTGVAAVAAATRDNNIGFAGIVDADLIASRAINCGAGFLHDSSDAVLWHIGEEVEGVRAVKAKADVINMSLGGEVDHCPDFMESAINKATEANVPVVVSVGNDQRDASGFTPANCAGSITVAAATTEGDLFPSSNYGTAIDIAALGEDVASATEYPDGIGWWEESSFATPIVAGVIANVVSEYDSVTVDEIKFFLSVTATPFAAGQCDDSNLCGAGILDANAFAKAVKQFKNEETLVLTPALNNTELCDKSLYLTDDNDKARLCETYELVLPEHQSNRDDIRFEVIAFEKDGSMQHGNGTLALSSTTNKLLVSTLDTDSYDYGVRMCNAERCYGNASVKITDKSADKPAICND